MSGRFLVVDPVNNEYGLISKETAFALVAAQDANIPSWACPGQDPGVGVVVLAPGITIAMVSPN